MGTVVTGSFSPTLPAATSVVVGSVVVRHTPLDYIARTTPYGLLPARYRRPPRRPTCQARPRS
ncbi:hypothetical protein F3K20_04700 [Streptomyces scabiei]|nr:hypothetical protein [Streptomyces sp. LBUM 1484]MBP5873969.1 hypothetical protein [Streptomyces sp. LBUM 1477]MBP5881684.1 hypothetical protein [Streptomyces sp. LBUM 1487]MBP5895446.1 hypothetical protein [Streptomyces sp. LBUM 1481]MBP5897456.1 hypothetical protein [Streptomyces sp. LBUM 1488]MBP5925741.1 hypothetical protein [Streptomyces sp. LBUM 1483]QTU44247.1 hypothetical protein F3K20_04700 [Streptomyces sp. LBUM 1482]QTU60390.1 hypothetical protein F3K22_04665 [Streptomyces sp. 